MRRVGLTRKVAVAVVVFSSLAACSSRAGDASEADCPIEDRELFVLMAQSVPSATLIPCIEALPAGWAYGGSDVSDDVARLPELVVRGLPERDAHALLDSVLASPLDARVCDQIVNDVAVRGVRGRLPRVRSRHEPREEFEDVQSWDVR